MGTDGRVDESVDDPDPEIENLVNECFEKYGVKLNYKMALNYLNYFPVRSICGISGCDAVAIYFARGVV